MTSSQNNSSPEQPREHKSLFDELEQCMLEDRFQLGRQLRKRLGRGQSIEGVAGKIARSRQRLGHRIAQKPAITLPEELPISAHHKHLVELMRDHQVIVVTGETGSGKSTQIPKICLEAGYGLRGMICQTQPRRIAARSVAQRISDELHSPVGEHVGYRMRFSEQINDGNYIRVLTDGMLLAEFESDQFLNRYEVVVIDEAHERSLNIDFLLGLCQRIAAKRPEFRLIITSATLDSEKFSKHFGDAPVLSVSGRTWPVTVRYRPMDSGEKTMDALPGAIYEAVRELQGEDPGDVLVFLPGEREIRETAEWLAKRVKAGYEILPLYARLTPAEQQKIFKTSAARRIILATNVAETSLTVPGIRYVIDCGLARVSRYSPTRKIQRLPLEKISRAAADQRAGRCGRIADGICIRLYEEEDYLGRPQYTDPEIKRTSLADVILRMKSMGLGDLEQFPFVDRPDRRQINDGMQHLLELGALGPDNRISAVGKQIARMPVDPRIARMLIAGKELNCLDDLIVIAAALSVPDPRQSPADRLEHSRQKHRALSKEPSDFLVLLDIWNQYRQIQKQQSKRQAYKWCEANFLSVFRMREWAALQANIKSILKGLRFGVGSQKGDPELIHRALLTGLLSNVAQLASPARTPDPATKKPRKKPANPYQGTFGKTLQVFPGSVMRGQFPAWIMSAELLETGQVYARTVAAVQPKWLESAAAHLLQYHYSNPVWDVSRQRVIARRRATLYGLTVYSGRRCDYSAINPGDCRMIFIRCALVDGGLQSPLPFYRHNRALVDEITALEHKTRRRDILVDDDEIYSFYDQVIPADVNNTSALRKWHDDLDEEARQRLLIPRERLLLGEPGKALSDYPDQVDNNGMTLPLDYLFDPSSGKDGVTAQISLPLLNQMNAAVIDRLVPGLLGPKLVALVRSLPKHLRRQLVPIPDTVARVENGVSGDKRPLAQALADALNDLKGTDIKAADFDMQKLPDYLRMGLELVDEDQRPVAYSRDLGQLQKEFGLRAHARFADAGDADIQRTNITRWDFDSLPETVTVRVGDYVTDAWPALVDCEDSVAIEIFDDPGDAVFAHQDGVRRLLWLALPEHRRLVKKPLPDWQRISLMYAAVGDLSNLQMSMFYKAQDRVFFQHRPPVRSRAQFAALVENEASKLPGVLVEIASSVRNTLTSYRQAVEALDKYGDRLPAQGVTDIRQQLEWLVYDGFVDDVPVQWLPHLARYLDAIVVRIEQARLDPATDQLRQQKVTPYWQRFLQCGFEYSEPLERWRYLVEEYRVSVFAQGLKTSQRVSPRRLDRGWDEVLADQARINQLS